MKNQFLTLQLLLTKKAFIVRKPPQQIIMWRLQAAQLSSTRSQQASDGYADAPKKATTKMLHLHVGPKSSTTATSSLLRLWRLPAAAQRFSLVATRYRQEQSCAMMSSATNTTNTTTPSGDDENTKHKDHNNTLYLHVGPAGECWTGHSIFAAKHLQPDYVRSLAIPANLNSSTLVSMLEEDAPLAQQIYDQSRFPTDLTERMQAFEKETKD